MARASSPVIRVIVSIEADSPAAHHRVVASLKKAGLRVSEELPDLGIVSGKIHPAYLKELEAVVGVVSVEPDRDVSVQSPGETTE